MRRYFQKGNSLIGGDVDAKTLKLKGYKEITRSEYEKLLAEILKRNREVVDKNAGKS